MRFVSPDQINPQADNPNPGNPAQPSINPRPVATQMSQPSPSPVSPTPSATMPTAAPQVHSFDVPADQNEPTPSGGLPPASSSGPMSYSQINSSKPKNTKKILLGVGAGTTLLVILLSGYIFGYHIPNQPANVWKTSLNRSGKALDKIVNSASEKETIAAYEKSDMNATIDVVAEGNTAKGAMDVKFGDSKANANFDISLKTEGETEKKLNTKLLFELPESSSYPNTYFKIDGVKSLGLDELNESVGEFDNKWIAIEAEYLKSLGAPTTSTEKIKNEQINSDDVAEIARAVTATATKYVFTAEPDKAIFVQKSFVGKEKVDDINAYHYKVAINNENSKKFCEALTEKLYSTKGYRKLNGGSDAEIEKSKTRDVKSCRESGNDFKDTDVYDLWVDSKYKLIHKIRFTNKDNPEMYTEIGQTYKGGDEVKMFVNYVDGKQKSVGKFTLETNLKTRTTKGTIVYGGKGTNPYDVKLTMQAKPYSGEIATTKPNGAIPIEQVLQKFGIDPKQQFAPTPTNYGPEDNPNVYTPLSSRTLDRITFSPSGIKYLKDAVDTSLQTTGVSPSINDLFDSSVRGSDIIKNNAEIPSTTQKITRIALSLLNQ